jgi:HEPN domain-containing protein
MPATESSLPQDWFTLADLDLQATDILLAEDGPLPVAAFHLQQAAEKYIKGYLLFKGWTLRRIHDLEVLIGEAIDRDEDFATFLEPCQRITEYYIESRYPTGLFSVFEVDQLKDDVTIVKELAEVITHKVAA